MYWHEPGEYDRNWILAVFLQEGWQVRPDKQELMNFHVYSQDHRRYHVILRTPEEGMGKNCFWSDS